MVALKPCDMHRVLSNTLVHSDTKTSDGDLLIRRPQTWALLLGMYVQYFELQDLKK